MASPTALHIGGHSGTWGLRGGGPRGVGGWVSTHPPPPPGLLLSGKGVAAWVGPGGAGGIRFRFSVAVRYWRLIAAAVKR